MEMNDTPTFELRRNISPIPEHSYESFYGAITSTSLPTWHTQSTMPAKLLGGLLLGAAISPGDAIAFQQQPVIQIEVGQQAIAPITVPQKLECIREAFGVSTSALADVLAVSRPTVYQWIKGQSEPTGENRNRLDQVALHAATWRKAFPGENMDHWLTDSEPGQTSLLDLLRQESQDTGAIRQLMVTRMQQAREANQRIEAARKASGMGELPAPEGLVPEEIYRWSETRQSMLRNSNLR
jgi:DNA-binding transcriptional regulator YiaG